MHQEYESAGYPSTRSISDSARKDNTLPATVSRDTVSAILKGRTLSSWPIVSTVVLTLRKTSDSPDRSLARIHELWTSAVKAEDGRAAENEPGAIAFAPRDPANIRDCTRSMAIFTLYLQSGMPSANDVVRELSTNPDSSSLQEADEIVAVISGQLVPTLEAASHIHDALIACAARDGLTPDPVDLPELWAERAIADTIAIDMEQVREILSAPRETKPHTMNFNPFTGESLRANVANNRFFDTTHGIPNAFLRASRVEQELPAALDSAAAVLVVTRGYIAGSVIVLADGHVSVGRAPHCRVVLDDLTLSRNHCVFYRTPGGEYFVLDAGSTNGTYVNQVAVSTNAGHRLVSNDLIEIGDVRFVFITVAEGHERWIAELAKQATDNARRPRVEP